MERRKKIALGLFGGIAAVGLFMWWRSRQAQAVAVPAATPSVTSGGTTALPSHAAGGSVLGAVPAGSKLVGTYNGKAQAFKLYRDGKTSRIYYEQYTRGAKAGQVIVVGAKAAAAIQGSPAFRRG